MDKTIDSKYPLLRRWTYPDSYAGATWYDYFGCFGRSRDSDALEESNFEVALRELGGETETVMIIREGHWAVGWVEWIAIHESDTRALEKANELRRRVESYPVLDEEHFSDLETARVVDYWDRCSVKEREGMLKEWASDVPLSDASLGWFDLVDKNQDSTDVLWEVLRE